MSSTALTEEVTQEVETHQEDANEQVTQDTDEVKDEIKETIENGNGVKEDTENVENAGDEKLEGEQISEEKGEGDGEEEGEVKVEGEQISEEGDGEDEGENVKAGQGEEEEAVEPKSEDEKDEGEQLESEELGEEELKVEEEETKKEEQVEEEQVEEEEPEYVEEPVDPAAPLNLTDSTEAVKPTFELRPEMLSEVERLWDMFQDYTPAYTDLKDYITVKELVYMLKALLLMTYTEEQLMELVTYVCRPPNENGHITYDQFLKMVMIRQRDFDIEEELRAALQVLDPGRTGEVESNELKDVLGKIGNKLAPKILDEFLKEIDLSGEGKIGIEDVVAICGMDLRKDDMIMGPSEPEEEEA